MLARGSQGSIEALVMTAILRASLLLVKFYDGLHEMGWVGVGTLRITSYQELHDVDILKPAPKGMYCGGFRSDN